MIAALRKPTCLSPTESPLLFEINPEPIYEALTALGGMPLVVQAFRSLGLPQSVAEQVHVKERARGYDEATPLITLVPLTTARIEKATLTAAASGVEASTMLFEVGSDLIVIDQLATLCSGVPLFYFCAGFGQPFLMLTKQFQRPVNHFVRIVVRLGAQHFSDQPLMLRS